MTLFLKLVFILSRFIEFLGCRKGAVAGVKNNYRCFRAVDKNYVEMRSTE